MLISVWNKPYAYSMLKAEEWSLSDNTDTLPLDIPFWYKFLNNFLLFNVIGPSKDFFPQYILTTPCWNFYISNKILIEREKEDGSLLPGLREAKAQVHLQSQSQKTSSISYKIA